MRRRTFFELFSNFPSHQFLNSLNATRPNFVLRPLEEFPKKKKKNKCKKKHDNGYGNVRDLHSFHSETFSHFPRPLHWLQVSVHCNIEALHNLSTCLLCSLGVFIVLFVSNIYIQRSLTENKVH